MSYPLCYVYLLFIAVWELYSIFFWLHDSPSRREMLILTWKFIATPQKTITKIFIFSTEYNFFFNSQTKYSTFFMYKAKKLILEKEAQNFCKVYFTLLLIKKNLKFLLMKWKMSFSVYVFNTYLLIFTNLNSFYKCTYFSQISWMIPAKGRFYENKKLYNVKHLTIYCVLF